MNTLKKTGFTLLALILTASAFSQKTSDISFIFSTELQYAGSFEYRKPLNQKYTFKIGLLQGGSITPSPYSVEKQFTYVSDSLIIERSKNGMQNNTTLKFGLEKQMGTSLFSFGADILLGIGWNHESFHNTRNEMNDSGVWNVIQPTPENNLIVDNPTSRTTNYFKPGIQAHISLNVPLKDRFFIHLHFTPTLYSAIYMGESNKYDPLNEFDDNHPTTYELTTQMGVGLRYRFKQ